MHSILDSLEKTKFEAQAATMEDLFPFLLVPGVLLLVLEALVARCCSSGGFRDALRVRLSSYPYGARARARGRAASARVRGDSGVVVVRARARGEALRRSGARREARHVRRDATARGEGRAARRSRSRSRSSRSRVRSSEGHAAHSGDEPRCRDRPRLLEEHVRARHRAEPHHARKGRGRAARFRSFPARASAPSRSRASR